MTGVLVLRYLEQLGYSNLTDESTLEDITLLKVYAYGTPSCFDAKLANSVDSFVTTVVLHDDVFPRLTPTSCRGLLKHLLYIRETWVEAHIEEDLRAVGERAKTAWAPRFRQNFALRSSTKSIKKYCKKQILRGKSKLTPVKDNATNGRPSNETADEYSDCVEIESLASDASPSGGRIVESQETAPAPIMETAMAPCCSVSLPPYSAALRRNSATSLKVVLEQPGTGVWPASSVGTDMPSSDMERTVATPTVLSMKSV